MRSTHFHSTTLQRAAEAAIALECAYRMHLARVALDDVKNPKKKGKKGKKKK